MSDKGIEINEAFDALVVSMDLDKDLALKFFLVISWFEYVLKELGYYTNRGYIDIDWIGFGNELDHHFDHLRTPKLKKATELLLEDTPKNQRIENGEIRWKVVAPKGELTELGKILYWVTTVRNNFFHGGKFPDFRVHDADLLNSCLIVLFECVEIHPRIKEIYDYQLRQK